jgi:two-component system alkaline phosphatase synthesis response regulator PhoP
MPSPRILIAEDEENLANTLARYFKLEGYEVLVARSGIDARALIVSQPAPFDLAILDVMLPGIDGHELCRISKSFHPQVPVIFLTARSDRPSTLEGLRLGADDYVKKPFDLDELLLRVSNLLKRIKQPESEAVMIRFGGGEINFKTFEIKDISGQTHSLSRREIGLLRLLTGSPGEVISRDKILRELWDPDENASARTIDNFILGFRKLFEKNPREPRHFQSVRGVGYKFTPH